MAKDRRNKPGEKWIYDPKTGREVDIANRVPPAMMPGTPAINWRFDGGGTRPAAPVPTQGFWGNLRQMANEYGVIRDVPNTPRVPSGPLNPPPPTMQAQATNAPQPATGTFSAKAPIGISTLGVNRNAAPVVNPTMTAPMSPPIGTPTVQTGTAAAPVMRQALPTVPPSGDGYSPAASVQTGTAAQRPVRTPVVVANPYQAPTPQQQAQNQQVIQQSGVPARDRMVDDVRRTNPVVAGNIADARQARQNVATSQAVTRGDTLDATRYTPEQQQQLRAAGADLNYSGFRPPVDPMNIGSRAIGDVPQVITADQLSEPLPPGTTASPEQQQRTQAAQQWLAQQTAREQADPQYQARLAEQRDQGRQIAAQARERNFADQQDRVEQQRQQAANYRELRQQAGIRGVSVQQLIRERDQQAQQQQQAAQQAAIAQAQNQRRQTQQPANAGLTGRGAGGEALRFADQPQDVQFQVFERAETGAKQAYDKMRNSTANRDRGLPDFDALTPQQQQQLMREWLAANTSWILP